MYCASCTAFVQETTFSSIINIFWSLIVQLMQVVEIKCNVLDCIQLNYRLQNSVGILFSCISLPPNSWHCCLVFYFLPQMLSVLLLLPQRTALSFLRNIVFCGPLELPFLPKQVSEVLGQR